MRPITATYRLQLNDGFPFAEAEKRIGYLAALGISHLYLSPILAARKGSQHGYDMVDPTRIDPQLGGEAGFRSLARAASRAGLGVILDIVPNHMAADSLNPSWMEVLEHGRRSPAARLFDIDWSADRILLPVLAGPLDEVLARGEIVIETDEATGRRMARYFDQIFPLRPDVREGGEGLPTLLDAQHWRLADWREASTDLTHRRFFNITELVGVRVEDPVVFDLVHRLPLALLSEGLCDGLRIDHVDGLADPEAYCRRLREAAGPHALIVVEKILEGDERLRDWPVDGTTGYDRLNDINGLYIDEAGYRRLDADLVERGLVAGGAAERLAKAKRQVLGELFGSEVARLSRLAAIAAPVLEADLANDAVMAIAVHFPVYRSYASERGHDAQDEGLWGRCSADIARLEPPRIAQAADVLLDLLCADQALAFAVGLQQLAGPAMAKGLEDTEFYRSVALLCANEVGADLARPAMSIERFHARNEAALARHDLVPLATHDTKRGVDVRARLALLSHDAEAAVERMAHWSRLAASARRNSDAPDALDEWLIVETILGAWPISAERLSAYLIKAMREAKRHTRWEDPRSTYEDAVLDFARRLVDGEEGRDFRGALQASLRTIDPAARTASLGQLILQLTIPGIPDTYQGTEFWDRSLVDPDNRRPVDWVAREEALAGGVWIDIADDGIGLAKFRALRRLLALRRREPRLFLEGSYEPIETEPSPARFVAFRRRLADASLIVAVPTRPGQLGAREALHGLPKGRWRNVMSERAFEIGSDGVALGQSWPFVIAHDERAP